MDRDCQGHVWCDPVSGSPLLSRASVVLPTSRPGLASANLHRPAVGQYTGRPVVGPTVVSVDRCVDCRRCWKKRLAKAD